MQTGLAKKKNPVCRTEAASSKALKYLNPPLYGFSRYLFYKISRCGICFTKQDQDSTSIDISWPTPMEFLPQLHKPSTHYTSFTPVTPPWCQRSHPQMLLTFQHKLNWEGTMILDWLQSSPFSSLFISNTMEQSSLKLNKTKVTRDKQSLLFYWSNTNFLPISGISWMMTKPKVRHSCLPSVASAIGCF